MSGRRTACRRLSSPWQALANVLLLRVVVIYVHSVYINLSTVKLAGSFSQPVSSAGCETFLTVGLKVGNWLLCSCQVPAPYEQQQTPPRSQAVSWATADIDAHSAVSRALCRALVHVCPWRTGEGKGKPGCLWKWDTETHHCGVHFYSAVITVTAWKGHLSTIPQVCQTLIKPCN